MAVAVKWEITIGQISTIVSLVGFLALQLIAWTWHEASQNSNIRDLQKYAVAHGKLDAHLGMERRAAGIEARQDVAETNLLRTNEILAEIRQDVRSLLGVRRGNADFDGR